MTPVPQVPVTSGPQNNPPALQAPNTPTVVATQPTVMAVPSLPVAANNPPNIPQPPVQQPGPVVMTPVPQLPVTSGPQNNPPALQAPNTPTVVATQPAVMAVPTLPMVVNNPPAIPQPPAQQPGLAVMTPVPQVPVTNGPQNNAPALLAPNAPTVIATQPTVMAVPSLTVVVNNPPAIPQPPAQQPGPVVLTPVPQVPVTSGPQINAPALQAPNAPTVVATQSTVMAVPSLPVVVNNPPAIPQPPAQQPGPVVMAPVPQLPVTSGPQNNPPALQAPNTLTVVATQPAVMAVPSLPMVVNNPPAIPQPPAQQPVPVVVTNVPPLPISSGPQNNPGALQGSNTPTVVASQPTAVAVPSIPVTVTPNQPIATPPAQQPVPVVVSSVPPLPIGSGPQNNPGALQGPNMLTVVTTQPTAVAVPSIPVTVMPNQSIATPPAQQPAAVVVTAQPPLPVVIGPQNNPGALQGPNTPTVVTTQPTAVAMPSLPVMVGNPPTDTQPSTQKPGPVIVTNLPPTTISSGPQNNPGAIQGPNTPTVIVTQTTPTQTTGPTPVDLISPGQVDGALVQTTPNQGGQTPTDQVGPQGPQQTPGHVTTQVAAGQRRLASVTVPSPVRESEIIGLRYNIVYRNYEAQSLVNDIGRPLYALASGYEFFLYLEGRPGQAINAPAIKPAPTGQ